MKRKQSRLLVMLIVSLIAAGIACNLPGGDRELAPTPIPVTTEAVQGLVTQVIVAATQAAIGGPITLEFTEEQLTSAAALELQSQDGYDVRDIQVRLRDGLIIITGAINQSGFSLPLEVSIRVVLTDGGVPQAQVINASIGPLSLPSSMTAQIEQSFNDTIRSELAAAGNNVVVDSIVIGEGRMTIQGHSQ